MFTLNQSPTYKWPVKVQLAADGGRFIEASFDALFNRLPQSKIEELRESIGTPDYSPREFARQVVAGWTGVQDGGGEVPFSQDALNALLEVPSAAAAIVVAYLESATGILRKN